MPKRIGVWLVGAFGGVGTTIALGIATLRRGLTSSTGLTTELPRFRSLNLVGFEHLVLGGHDVRRTGFQATAAELHRNSGVFSAESLTATQAELAEWSANVRPGVVIGSGRPVEEFADWKASQPCNSARMAIEHLTADLNDFASRNSVDHCIVLNVASSEPIASLAPELSNWSRLESALSDPAAQPLPASSLYALAACAAGCSYVNFTPSLGLAAPALEERATAAGILYAGRDGKTGETLMKSVLAPMFVRRNLQVLSWVGHNILGNRDGLVLQDPANKQGKMESKGRLLHEILGYEPHSLVSIEHVDSLADWKTAWDHIHFTGFLDTKMTLQFIWQGCDSILAAPLAIDLVRWTELAHRRGERGCMKHLACYFKSPMHVAEHDFYRQLQMLDAYADGN